MEEDDTEWKNSFVAPAAVNPAAANATGKTLAGKLLLFGCWLRTDMLIIALIMQ